MRLKRYTFLLASLVITFISGHSVAQKQGTITGDRLMGAQNKNGERYEKWLGNVVFVQEGTRIYCDSAFYYKKRELVEAFGSVRILDGDSVTITGRKLIYNSKEKKSRLLDNVVYKKDSLTLYTDVLNYDVNSKVADYVGGGRIVDPRNELVSEIGVFFSAEYFMQFKNDVVLKNEEYTLYSDTLVYYTQTKVADFKGPTQIVGPDGTVDADNGLLYRTSGRQSTLREGKVESPSYVLSGQRLYLDEMKNFYRANTDVRLVSKDQDVIITGDQGRYWRDQGMTKVFGRAVMRKVVGQDTVYLSADTLVAIDSKVDAEKRVLAYPDVRIWKSNLQGRADSLAYFVADSLIRFFDDPILWSDRNQIEGDSIWITLKNKGLDRMFVRQNSFVVSEDTLNNYNQVKGRNMVATFRENDIRSVDVEGNGESIYFALERDTILTGMNKIICSNMKIFFDESQLSRINFYVQPDANFIPPHEITTDQRTLDGFSWRIKSRPTLSDVLLRPDMNENSEQQKLPGMEFYEEDEELPESPSELSEKQEQSSNKD
ncbi:MAG: OstA-like protein [Cyclobacteriaceae bacterium]